MQTAKNLMAGYFSLIKTKHINQVQIFFAAVVKFFNGFLGAVKKNFLAMTSTLLLQPSSLEDYVKLGDLYISKRFLARCVLGLTMVIGILMFYVIPQLEGRLWTPVILLNSEKFHGYSGMAKVVNKEGILIYEGQLEKGIISGSGKLYESGQLIYQGTFVNNAYSGKGTRYANGKVKYDGVFNQNVFEGKGTTYYESGRMEYQGDFLAGEYGGTGVLRADDENNTVLYRGNFEGGNYNGQGNLFSGTRLLYSGGFANGTYGGEGKLYDVTTGTLLYMGAFAEGLYSGKGSFYSKNKSLLYEGLFSRGLYEGKGRLYDEKTGRVMYEGEFSNGLYNGEGILYSSAGRIIYQGKFFAGMINFAAMIGKDIDQIRGIFGKEDELKMQSHDFVLLYHHSQMAFICSFAENGAKPAFKSVVFFGKQNVDGIQRQETIRALQEKLTKVPFQKDTFTVGEDEAFFYNLSGAAISAGSPAYRIQYQKEDVSFTIYANGPQGQICYYEVGGI